MQRDEKYMKLALKEAQKGVGRTSPNPPVGCIIVKNNKIIGKGYHHKAGQPHAEIMALRDAHKNNPTEIPGATAYVTLEPCNHFGKTPPCTEAIIKAGIKKIIIATIDPNPQVSKKGIARLKDSNIEVVLGICQDLAKRQQKGFISSIIRKRPYISYKYAMTLDGKIAANSEGNGKITKSLAIKEVMKLRNTYDAIAIGANTLRLDNPSLNVREIKGRDPKIVIFSKNASVANFNAKIFKEGTFFVSENISKEQKILLENQKVEVIKENLQDSLEILNKKGISTILLEGGSDLASEFTKLDLIDELYIFIGSKILGEGKTPLNMPNSGMIDAKNFKIINTKLLGDDIFINAIKEQNVYRDN